MTDRTKIRTKTYECTFEDGGIDHSTIPADVDVFKLIDEYNATFEDGIVQVEYTKYLAERDCNNIQHIKVPIKRVPCTNKREKFMGVNNCDAIMPIRFHRDGKTDEYYNGKIFRTYSGPGLDYFYEFCRDGQTDWVDPAEM